MKKIRCLKDFNQIKGKFPKEYLEYLEVEFYNLYEYLNNDGKNMNFILF